MGWGVKPKQRLKRICGENEENDGHKHETNAGSGGNERRKTEKMKGMKKKMRPPILKIREGWLESAGATEDALKHCCLEFILSCHAVLDLLSGISFCKD